MIHIRSHQGLKAWSQGVTQSLSSWVVLGDSDMAESESHAQSPRQESESHPKFRYELVEFDRLGWGTANSFPICPGQIVLSASLYSARLSPTRLSRVSYKCASRGVIWLVRDQVQAVLADF